MKHRITSSGLFLAALLITAMARPVTAAEPTDKPVTSPASQPAVSVATLRSWLGDLSNTDSEVREKARVQLMGIGRLGLEPLRQAVADSRPLAPSQTAVLQEIVSQVYLSGEDEENPSGPGGFLGVRISSDSIEIAVQAAHHPEAPLVGVMVASRLPGFCGYRMLEDGDVILSLTSDKTYAFHSPNDLSEVVSQQHGGDAVTLDVLRRGKMIHIPVTLDHKPIWVGQLIEGDPLAPRQKRAADYWDRTFAPLLTNSSGHGP